MRHVNMCVWNKTGLVSRHTLRSRHATCFEKESGNAFGIFLGFFTDMLFFTDILRQRSDAFRKKDEQPSMITIGVTTITRGDQAAILPRTRTRHHAPLGPPPTPPAPPGSRNHHRLMLTRPPDSGICGPLKQQHGSVSIRLVSRRRLGTSLVGKSNG